MSKGALDCGEGGASRPVPSCPCASDARRSIASIVHSSIRPKSAAILIVLLSPCTSPSSPALHLRRGARRHPAVHRLYEVVGCPRPCRCPVLPFVRHCRPGRLDGGKRHPTA